MRFECGERVLIFWIEMMESDGFKGLKRDGLRNLGGWKL